MAHQLAVRIFDGHQSGLGAPATDSTKRGGSGELTLDIIEPVGTKLGRHLCRACARDRSDVYQDLTQHRMIDVEATVVVERHRPITVFDGLGSTRAEQHHQGQDPHTGYLSEVLAYSKPGIRRDLSANHARQAGTCISTASSVGMRTDSTAALSNDSTIAEIQAPWNMGRAAISKITTR